MNDTATATPAAPKVLTVIEDMDSRRMFNDTASAIAYLNLMSETISDFNSQTIIAKGVSASESGEMLFDPAVYTTDMRVMISVLTQRIHEGKSRVIAIVIVPAPTRESILANEAAVQWLDKIIDKELNHVAVRALRNPKEGSNLDELSEQMPTTLNAYITSSREGGGAIETYNDLARGLIDSIGKQSKVWLKARLTKPELKAAMASKEYASEYYPTLEDRGEGKESLFVMALNFGKQVAVSKGLAPDIFDRWLSSRDETKLTGKADGDEGEDDIDLDSLTFVEPKAATPATATEPAATVEPEPVVTA